MRAKRKHPVISLAPKARGEVAKAVKSTNVRKLLHKLLHKQAPLSFRSLAFFWVLVSISHLFEQIEHMYF